ncbi:E6 [Gammapapillomavirus 12]|uniref:Protein E6 n=2 Tax=Papillomaviridae TaxID=151340 RepID=A0A2D2ALL2_9PAPI|nr:E6 [Gammapapillomavirus 12]AYD41538.1 MAG: E6 protein [Human papillomavirus]
MEPQYPNNIEDYCNQFNISFFKLGLKCVFCKHKLDCVQLASFHHKKLSLLWRDGECFACCTSCLRLSANYEVERFYRCSFNANVIEDAFCAPLTELMIRCIHCYNLLDYIEKREHQMRDEPFHLVRQHLRGSCRHCVQK